MVLDSGGARGGDYCNTTLSQECELHYSSGHIYTQCSSNSNTPIIYQATITLKMTVYGMPLFCLKYNLKRYWVSTGTLCMYCVPLYA